MNIPLSDCATSILRKQDIYLMSNHFLLFDHVFLEFLEYFWVTGENQHAIHVDRYIQL